jgi:hypothetical protein
MVRLPLLAGLGVLLAAPPAPAQFFGNVGARNFGFNQRYANPFGGFGPSVSPLVSGFAYRNSYRYGVTVPGQGGPITISYGATIQYGSYGIGALPPRLVTPNYLTPTYTYGGYITGGAGNPAAENAQANFERAQREATAMRNRVVPAKTQIYDQWAYEKLGVAGLAGLEKPADQPEALRNALAVEDESQVASGEVLNHVLSAAVALESKGAKGASAFLPPQLLNEIRFTGSPAAEALNTIRTAGKLDHPAAFDADPLRPHAAALEREFAALVAPVLLGRTADSARLAKFEGVLKVAHDAAAPQVRALPFEDAIAVRRYLNRLDAVVKVLKDQTAIGFVNPKWNTEGTNVADLVKHMTKYKLLFGPAERGSEEAYLAVHRGLGTYLAALSQKK